MVFHISSLLLGQIRMASLVHYTTQQPHLQPSKATIIFSFTIFGSIYIAVNEMGASGIKHSTSMHSHRVFAPRNLRLLTAVACTCYRNHEFLLQHCCEIGKY